mmetsp:Transcript_10810/g.23883  ORF Transcript_10810/g.23883 Transcript_10810/m.23883 type:complete len:647 (+) Transcript_10810:59-1999(+)|eukprot:CAMPEP_0204394800 /NCGR_PEP_ID=MMETSP0469-20131031/63016_1 /ASSEMBLY_ACC=CAM_ASM_000384 /TAXON_ID=2969 /ORGANISM="Oxyrrhis marina" /LENGTH=646 /DNA_ID=CAMNT_0051388911 /DNA_START=33 /DNA_END=1973 /DNA_ORIENTATION=-
MIHILVEQVGDLLNIGDGFLRLGKQDPYVELCNGGKHVKTKPQMDAGTAATFNEELQLEYDGSPLLKILVNDHEERGEHRPISSGDINLDAVARRAGATTGDWAWEGRLDLFTSGTIPAGWVDLKLRIPEGVVQFILQDVAQGPRVDLVRAVRAKRHRHRRTAAIQAWSGDEQNSTFFTYEVAIQQIQEVFGEKHQPYAAPSPKFDIAALNLAIKGEHKLLYRDGKVEEGKIGDETQSRHSKWCTLRTGEDFLDLMCRGYRDGHRRVFTFCINDVAMFFSETGSTLAMDTTSKHAVHANGEKQVRYAGTFRVVEKPTGEPMLWFDNDSGTYKPDANDLELLAQLMSINFPGIEMRGVNVRVEHSPEVGQLLGPCELGKDKHRKEGDAKPAPSIERAAVYKCGAESWKFLCGGFTTLDQAGLDALVACKSVTAVPQWPPSQHWPNELAPFLDRYLESVSLKATTAEALTTFAHSLLCPGPGIRYLRLTVTVTRDPDAPFVHLGRVRVEHKTGELALAGAAGLPGSRCGAAEGPAQLVVGDGKWADGGKKGFVVDLGQCVAPARMLLLTAMDAPGSDPQTWTLDASPNGVAWQQVATSEKTQALPESRGTWSAAVDLPEVGELPASGGTWDLAALDQLLQAQAWVKPL